MHSTLGYRSPAPALHDHRSRGLMHQTNQPERLSGNPDTAQAISSDGDTSAALPRRANDQPRSTRSLVSMTVVKSFHLPVRHQIDNDLSATTARTR